VGSSRATRSGPVALEDRFRDERAPTYRRGLYAMDDVTLHSQTLAQRVVLDD
jgi:hypothetical protein